VTGLLSKMGEDGKADRAVSIALSADGRFDYALS
jgi:hypothetical protein